MAAQTERPLSPFMTYRWTLTMIMSIIHRVTGLGLYAGTLLMAWWLIATASSPAAYACLQSFTSSWIGRLVEIGFTWSLFIMPSAGCATSCGTPDTASASKPANG